MHVHRVLSPLCSTMPILSAEDLRLLCVAVHMRTAAETCAPVAVHVAMARRSLRVAPKRASGPGAARFTLSVRRGRFPRCEP